MLVPTILSLMTILVLCISQLYKYWLGKNLFKKVVWCVSSDKNRNNLSLYDCIYNIQKEMNIEQKYRISGNEELSILKEILSIYQKETLKYFLDNRLTSIIKIAVLSSKEYFVFSLRNFLLENELDKKYLFFNQKIEMYDEELVWYNENGCENYIYTLTPFSMVYHKLLLSCLSFCECNDRIKKISNLWTTANTIKERLDKGEIDVRRR